MSVCVGWVGGGYATLARRRCENYLPPPTIFRPVEGTRRNQGPPLVVSNCVKYGVCLHVRDLIFDKGHDLLFEEEVDLLLGRVHVDVHELLR